MKPADPLGPAGRGRVGRLLRDRAGASAVEFALTVPLLIFIAFGVVTLGLGVTATRKVQQLAYEIGDLVAEDTSVTQADVSDVFAASTILLPPSLQGNLSMRIMSVTAVSQGQNVTGAQVAWCQVNINTGPLTCPAVGTSLPNFPMTLLPNPTSSVIESDVVNTYTGVISGFLPNGVQLRGTNYLSPRESTSVAWEN